MESTKNCGKKNIGEGGIRKRIRGVKFGQDTLYTCMETS
jgi:hypothetical protein